MVAGLEEGAADLVGVARPVLRLERRALQRVERAEQRRVARPLSRSSVAASRLALRDQMAAMDAPHRSSSAPGSDGSLATDTSALSASGWSWAPSAAAAAFRSWGGAERSRRTATSAAAGDFRHGRAAPPPALGTPPTSALPFLYGIESVARDLVFQHGCQRPTADVQHGHSSRV